MRSHPPTLITLGKRALVDEIAIAPKTRILVATSGGPDSMALLDVLAALQAPLHFTIVAHGVDHGLRPEASRELDLAEALAKKLGVSFSRTRVNVKSAIARRGNLQAEARKARYAALEAARKKSRAHFIATAHHAQDRAETVLMRILRGAGASGLAVLPPRDGRLIRPLIRAHREDVILHLERHEIGFATDPSNQDRHFLRSKVRHEIFPALTALDANLVDHLCAIADDLAPNRQKTASYTLSRATRTALAKLALTKKGIVLLPGGLVATQKTTKKR